MEEKIKQIQDKIVSFLKEGMNLPLSRLCKDSCSEISRLTSYWLYSENSDDQYFILKSANLKNETAHDILMIKHLNQYHLLDPSIWQFLPEENSIYLGKFNSIEEALLFLKDKYTGNWSVSEEMDKKSFKEKNQWVEIIRNNIHTIEDR